MEQGSKGSKKLLGFGLFRRKKKSSSSKRRGKSKSRSTGSRRAPEAYKAPKPKAGQTLVTFTVHADLAKKESLFVVGSDPALGSWDADKGAIELIPARESGIYGNSVCLPSGATIEYKYLVKSKRHVLRYEALEGGARSTTPYVGQDAAVVVDWFGKLPPAERWRRTAKEQLAVAKGGTPPVAASLAWVDKGWVMGYHQLRVYVGGRGGDKSSEAVVWHDIRKEDKDFLITISPLNAAAADSLPSSDAGYVIEGESAAALGFVATFSRKSAPLSRPLGRVTVEADDLAAGWGPLTRPIMSKGQIVGSLQMHYMVVRPFVHPANNLAHQAKDWDKTVATIGHRGGGAQSVPGTKYTENTLLSMKSATEMGAVYIEFDVQLTSDGVPVIWHDHHVDVRDKTMPKSPLIRKLVNTLSMSDLGNLAPTPYTADPKAVTNTVGELIQTYCRGEDSVIQGDFATLEEVFASLPTSVGFDIEIKYPDTEEQAAVYGYTDRNTLIDKILEVVFGAIGSGRHVVFSSFDPEICIMTVLKQPVFPVFFLTEGGLNLYPDPRLNSVQAGLDLAAAFHMHGIVCDSASLLGKKLADYVAQAHKRGLLLFSYGDMNNELDNVIAQREAGVDAVIGDRVAQVFRPGEKVLSHKRLLAKVVAAWKSSHGHSA